MEKLTSIDQLTESNKKLAATYIQAVGKKQAELFPELLHEQVVFNGVLMSFRSARELGNAFQQLGKVLQRNDIHKIFADESGACVIYDLILADDLDPIPCMEWIKTENGKITDIRLVFDSKLFLKVRGELTDRLSKN